MKKIITAMVAGSTGVFVAGVLAHGYWLLFKLGWNLVGKIF